MPKRCRQAPEFRQEPLPHPRGRGYGDFKMAVGEAVVEELRPIRERYETFISDKKELERIYKEGAERAGYIARKTAFKAMKKVGFVL